MHLLFIASGELIRYALGQIYLMLSHKLVNSFLSFVDHIHLGLIAYFVKGDIAYKEGVLTLNHRSSLDEVEGSQLA